MGNCYHSITCRTCCVHCRKHCNRFFVLWIEFFHSLFFVISQDIPPSLIVWAVFSAAFESFLVEFSYVNVPYFSIISVRLQINKYLHVCKYVIEKAKLHFKKKLVVFTYYHTSWFGISTSKYTKDDIISILYRLIFVCFPSVLKDWCYWFQLSHLQAVVV